MNLSWSRVSLQNTCSIQNCQHRPCSRTVLPCHTVWTLLWAFNSAHYTDTYTACVHTCSVDTPHNLPGQQPGRHCNATAAAAQPSLQPAQAHHLSHLAGNLLSLPQLGTTDTARPNGSTATHSYMLCCMLSTTPFPLHMHSCCIARMLTNGCLLLHAHADAVPSPCMQRSTHTMQYLDQRTPPCTPSAHACRAAAALLPLPSRCHSALRGHRTRSAQNEATKKTIP